MSHAIKVTHRAGSPYPWTAHVLDGDGYSVVNTVGIGTSREVALADTRERWARLCAANVISVEVVPLAEDSSV